MTSVWPMATRMVEESRLPKLVLWPPQALLVYVIKNKLSFKHPDLLWLSEEEGLAPTEKCHLINES